MNCAKCGAALPAGAQVCPVCGTPVPGARGQAGGYMPQQGGYQAQPQQPQQSGYQPQQGGYQEPQQPRQPQTGYRADQYAQGYGQNGTGYVPPAGAPNGYAQGYGYQQQTYGGYGAYGGGRRAGGDVMESISNLPTVIRGIFLNPGDALRGMMERNDRYTGAVVIGLTLLLTFLSAILLSRSLIGSLLSLLSGLSSSYSAGTAGIDASVNTIASKTAASVGGIAALCQVLAIVFPAAVALVYLCVVKKVRFSFLLASNLVAIVTLPSVPAALLGMIGSLIAPAVGFAIILIGEVASYVLLCALVAWATGQAEQRMVGTKIILVCSSELLKVLFIRLIGGALAASVIATVTSMLSNLGSLM